MKEFTNSKANNRKLWVTAIIVVLNSGYYLATIKDSYIPLALLICWSFILIFTSKKSIYLKSVPVIMLLLGIVLSVVANASMANLLSGGRVAVTMLCVYFISQVIDFKDFVSVYAKLIEIIIVISLLLYGVLSVYSLSFVKRIVSGNNSYYNLLIVSHIVGSERLVGAFWEPGVFASHIIFASLGEIFITPEKIKAGRIFILILGMLFTRSTAGIMIMFIVLIGLLLKKLELDENKFVLTLFICMIIAGIVYYDALFERLAQIAPGVFSKLVETNSATNLTRTQSPIINLEIFMKKPITGWGFTGAATLFTDYMSTKIVAQTSTNTQILSAIGFLGIGYTFLCVGPLFSKSKLPKISFTNKLILVSAIILIANKEPHVYFAITWLLLFFINKHEQNVPFEESAK